MFHVKCFTYSVSCTVFHVECFVYSFLCMVFRVRFIVYGVSLSVFVFHKRCLLYGVTYMVFYVQCFMYSFTSLHEWCLCIMFRAYFQCSLYHDSCMVFSYTVFRVWCFCTVVRVQHFVYRVPCTRYRLPCTVNKVLNLSLQVSASLERYSFSNILACIGINTSHLYITLQYNLFNLRNDRG